MLTDDKTAEQDELEEQLWTATEELQKAVMRLFQDRDIHPHLVVLALARVTGEVGAGTALAGERDPEELLGDLGEVVRGGGGGVHEGGEGGRAPVPREGAAGDAADRGERLSRDQWRRPALTAETSSDSKNCRLRYSRAKRRRSRCDLSCVLVLPARAALCRATSRSACAINASIWARARWR